jgi:hypothetical protein
LMMTKGTWHLALSSQLSVLSYQYSVVGVQFPVGGTAEN